MKDYFSDLKKFLKNKYTVIIHEEVLYNIEVDKILGFEVNSEVKNVYRHYKIFDLVWLHNNKCIGEVHFVSYKNLEREHNELEGIMRKFYDVKWDRYSIVQDIKNWYPLFKFNNGDAFCLDIRNGRVVLYEHEVFDVGKNLHGLTIAKSLNDLFDKWGHIHFKNVYYWDEICDEDGIDIDSELD